MSTQLIALLMFLLLTYLLFRRPASAARATEAPGATVAMPDASPTPNEADGAA
jgi:hypothetical protein